MANKKPSALQERVKKQYLDYLRLFPKVKIQNIGVYTTILLTLFTLSFFIIFAIKPTLATILTLKKQIADSRYVDEQMKSKLSALSSLHTQYEQMPSDVQVVLRAVPQKPDVPYFLAQIQSIAKASNVTLSSANASPIPLSRNEIRLKKATSFSFTIQLDGTYDNLMQAISEIGHFDRLVSFDTISLTKGKTAPLSASIQGKAYFQSN